MPQTIGTGGGKASRQFSGNLYRIIREQDIKNGTAYVADHLKVEMELNSIFNSINFADPTVIGSQANGNFGGAMVQFTTASTTGTEFKVNHAMGRIPVGWINCGLASNKAGSVGTLIQTRAADTQNLYLKILNPEDVSITTAIIVW